MSIHVIREKFGREIFQTDPIVYFELSKKTTCV